MATARRGRRPALEPGSGPRTRAKTRVRSALNEMSASELAATPRTLLENHPDLKPAPEAIAPRWYRRFEKQATRLMATATKVRCRARNPEGLR